MLKPFPNQDAGYRITSKVLMSTRREDFRVRLPRRRQRPTELVETGRPHPGPGEVVLRVAAGYGRLIPLTLIPLWDVELAAAETRRCASKGAHAIAFSECPSYLGLPSIHSGYWNPLWEACEETDTVVNMHIGSSSTWPSTGPDSPALVPKSLSFQNAQVAFADWLASGLLETFGAADRAQRGSGRLDPVRSRAPGQRVGAWPSVRGRYPGAPAPPAQQLNRGARLRLHLRRRERPAGA
jgi:Amidohydrolase